jgi:hypothetical protein
MAPNPSGTPTMRYPDEPTASPTFNKGLTDQPSATGFNHVISAAAKAPLQKNSQIGNTTSFKYNDFTVSSKMNISK